MVRATATEVVKKWAGAYPAPWDATSVGHICTQVDEEMNSMASPSTLSTTDTKVIEFANELVFRKVNYDRWASGPMDGQAPAVWDNHMTTWFQRLLTNTTTDAIGYIKGQGSS